MYGYPYTPPPYYGYPQPQYPQTPPSPNDIEKGMKIALKLRAKEERKEEKKKADAEKKKSDEKKKAEESKGRSLLSLEWFILGILAYPFVGPAYNYLIKLSH